MVPLTFNGPVADNKGKSLELVHFRSGEVLVAGAELKLSQSIICGSLDYACLGWQILGKLLVFNCPRQMV